MRKDRKNSLEPKGWTVAAMSGERNERNGLRTLDKLREPPCEWSWGWCKREPDEGRRLAPYVEVEGWRGFLLFLQKP